MMSLPPEEGITPDRWVMLEIDTGEETIRRILSGWSGGYLEGNSWRLSSPVIEESSDDTRYIFTTRSGSTYICRSTAEGLTVTTSGMYNILEKKFEKQGGKTRMLCYGDQT
jgi:hypothetical protein